ncbi:MAG: tryptophan--tRNA ligase, partial [Chloroflexota bacterium]
DPKRVSAAIPGTVEGNPVFAYHDAFNADKDEVADLKDRYRKGKVGDVEVKKKLIRALNEFLEPIRERRSRFDRSKVEQLLAEGTQRARSEAQETMRLVREAMGLYRPIE